MALAIGSQRIPFKLKGVDGQWHSLEDLSKDKQATVIIFSCNHCPYVQAWEDRMIEIGKSYASRGVSFALINPNDAQKYPEDSYAQMIKRAQAKGYPFPYLHDEDQSVAQAYGATRTPEVFVFDAQGILRYHGRIDDNYESAKNVQSHDLRNALDALLEGKTPPVVETEPIGCTIKWK